MLLRVVGAAMAIILATGCGGANGSSAKSASDTDGGGSPSAGKSSLQSGATVCIAELLGIRYELEDLVREQDLEPVRECDYSDVQIAEEGEPGAFVMRYRSTGDQDWQSCKSSSQDRNEFARDCLIEMKSKLGSSGDDKPPASEK